MKLSESQVQKMLERGMTMDDIQREASVRGDTLPQKRDVLGSVTRGVNKVFAGGKVGEAIGTLGGYAYTKAKDKIRGTNVAQYYDLSAPSPLQVLGDVGQGAIQVGSAMAPLPGSLLGKVAQAGAFGAGAGFTSGVAEGKSIEESTKQGVRGGIVGGLMGLTFGVLEKGVRVLGKGVSKTGEAIQTKVINPHKVDFDDGFNVKNIEKYGLGGSLAKTQEKVDAKLAVLARELKTKLASTPNVAVDMNDIYRQTEAALRADKYKNFAVASRIQSALDDVQRGITETAGKNGLVSIPEAQLMKQSAGQAGSWVYGRPDPDGKAAEVVYNKLYSILKKEIEKASPAGVQEINRQISELIPIQNAVIRQIPVASRAAPLSFSDALTLAAAIFDPRALTLTAANRAQRSGAVGSLLVKGGQKLTGTLAQKAGQVGQFVQTLGR